MAIFYVLALPPFKQNREALTFPHGFPVKLRRQVINCSVLQPFFSVGVKFAVSIKACDVFLRKRLPDAKRRNAIHYVWFYSLDFAPDSLNKIIDVCPPPFISL